MLEDLDNCFDGYRVGGRAGRTHDQQCQIARAPVGIAVVSVTATLNRDAVAVDLLWCADERHAHSVEYVFGCRLEGRVDDSEVRRATHG